MAKILWFEFQIMVWLGTLSTENGCKRAKQQIVRYNIVLNNLCLCTFESAAEHFCYHVETCQYVMAIDNVLKLNIHRSDLPCHHWELFLRTHYHIPLSHGSLWSLTAPVTCHFPKFSKTIVSQLYVISFPHSTPAFVAYGGEILLLLCMLSGGTYWFAISIGKG